MPKPIDPVCAKCKRLKPKCKKCKKYIAHERLTCTVCTKRFHPGCIDHYLKRLNIERCCERNSTDCFDSERDRLLCVCYFDNISEIASTLTETVIGEASLIINANSANCLLSIEPDILLDTLRPNELFKNMSLQDKMSEKLSKGGKSTPGTSDDILAKILNKIESTEAKVIALSDSQKTTNDEFRTLLNKIPLIEKTVANHNMKINAIQNENDQLRKEIEDLRSNVNSSSAKSEELIVAGIPSSTCAPLKDITIKILQVLGLPKLSAHILDVRPLVRKNSTMENAVETEQNRKTTSFIVRFTSGAVCNMILQKRREKRMLKRSEIFEDCSAATKDLNIYLNQMLASSVYKLHQLARKKAKEISYKYVWVKDGQIFMKKEEGGERINIRSAGDLEKLE